MSFGHMRYTIAVMLLLITALSAGKIADEERTKQAIVKIYTVSKTPNYLEPWSSTMRRSSGSGAIIPGHRILTNAHVVANHTFIEVQRYGDRKRYIARVLSVSHQADLALLGVEDEEFFFGIEPLTLGDLPKIEQEVVVYGYPMGGSTLSATTGVVSRIEHQRYAHSGEYFLSIQVDAAVNPGNSGGPAISDGKIVGVVMQSLRKSQNIGYLVPVNMIRHFLDDIADGRYDGFGRFGLALQNMENPAMRRYFHLDDDTTGNLISHIVYNSSANGILKEGDIILSIDGNKVENDGTVAFRKHEYTSLIYMLDKHQIGDTVTFEIMRDRKRMKVKATLKQIADDMILVKTTRYDTMPRYFIYGGYVFSPLTRNLLAMAGSNRTDLYSYLLRRPSKEKKEVVVLLKVLASDISRGNYDITLWPVEKINGEKFDTFDTFYKKMFSSKKEFIILENERGVKLILDRNESMKKQNEILQRYNIEFDRSSDLRKEKKIESGD